MPYSSLSAFLIPADPHAISGDEGYETGQIGQMLLQDNDLETADLVIVGCNEWRGAGPGAADLNPDIIREQLYKLYHWHHEIKIADAGTIVTGAGIKDTYAAMKMVVKDLVDSGKKVLVIGGSHDNTLPLYQVFAEREQIIEATVIDALIDLDKYNQKASRRFLLEMLTKSPNYIRHFNLVGFQSYFTYPDLLETIDKLRFDCFRVGRVQEKMDEVEPAIRSSHLLSVDMNAVAHAYAPANALSPNGFTGQDMCKLMQYAGMSDTTIVTGLFNFAGNDPYNLTAMQVAQMVWYFMDGMQKQKHETSLDDRSGYNEYHTLCAEVDTLFLQSRNTSRWWMQMPDKNFIACSFADYYAASNNDLPERWLRTQERM
ncbi:MAG: formimidoylglutamase [Bacteroidota bacterium]